MKNLVVDITFLQDQYYRRGIGRYGREIVSRMVTIKSREISLHLIGFGNLDSNLEKLELNEEVNFSDLHFYSLGDPLLSSPIANLKLYLSKVKPLVKSISPDLYFAAHSDRIIPSEICPTVTTIHDLIPLMTGKYSQKNIVVNYIKGYYYRFALNKALDSRIIFTISEYSKNDLIGQGVPAEKIVVAPLGVSSVFSSNRLNKSILAELKLTPESYLLYDSGHEPNKNSLKLLDLIKRLSDLGFKTNLIVTGGDFYKSISKPIKAKTQRGKYFINYADKLGIKDQITASGTASEVDMAVLFQNSLAYVNFSKYEGFGLGILQAMAAKTPAIISNSTTYPEVAGGAAMLIDPEKLQNYMPQILELLTNKEQRQALIAKGDQRVKLFNWDRCFEITWKGLMSKI